MYIRLIAASAGIALSAIPQASMAENTFRNEDFKDSARIRVTSRITAQTSVVTLQKETPSFYDDTELTLHSCWRAPLTRKQESAALISALRAQTRSTPVRKETLVEDVAADDVSPLFYGWIFASAPAATFIPHPIYTFRLLECGVTEQSTQDRSYADDDDIADSDIDENRD